MENLTVPKTKIATVTFLIRDDTVCLAVKKQDINTGDKDLKNTKKWNGYGGKQENEDNSIRHTAVRENKEEALIESSLEDLIPCGRVRFYWPGNKTGVPNMDVYFFFLKVWEGVPRETHAMSEPQFFPFDEIPYESMMPDNQLFLPRMLSGEKIVADMFYEFDEEGNQKIKNCTEHPNEVIVV